jgi:hypothetical protein
MLNLLSKMLNCDICEAYGQLNLSTCSLIVIFVKRMVSLIYLQKFSKFIDLQPKLRF